MKISIIGSGNVATHLALELYNSYYKIIDIYSRNIENAKILATKVHANAIDNIKELSANVDVILISVSDDALEKILSEIKLEGKVLVHTSGTIPISAFKKYSKNYGVLYPLQTFSKHKHVNFESVPICIEGNNQETLAQIKIIAKELSKKVVEVNSDQRKKMHIAAVFACNFSNHMYSISKEIMEKHELNFDILKPLIMETTSKIMDNDPKEMQTGPAVRKDVGVLNEHIKHLNFNKDYQEIYKLVSESIQKIR